ncbi:MAG: S8 family serine peptidase [Acidobacteriota bacterium]
MANESGPGGAPPARAPQQAEFTGRYLLLGRQANDTGLPKTLRDKAGLTVASSSDFPRGAVDMARFGGADGVYFEKLGVAVTSSAPDQGAPLMGPMSAGDLLTVERERIVYVFQAPRRDNAPMAMPARLGEFAPQGIDNLVCSLAAPSLFQGPAEVDESARTWGLASSRVIESSWTGRGVRVAVLDTGFDLNHPDFAGRSVVSHSFIDGETAQDAHSHGTHCIGTALGPARPPAPPRYGVAFAADIYAGKVLGNSGRGSDGAVLAAINWAMTNGCRVISMSLGSATQRGQRYSQVFETAAQRAMAGNTIIIAAAGNESDRNKDIINPVGHPANCPSIMAVGAVDADMKIAYFSTRGMDPDGGGVDILGPGVNVYSTVPPGAHGRKNGTSMATPHVAGIAALYAEANPNATAREIWQLLVTNARRLALDPADMGAGFVQAPR